MQSLDYHNAQYANNFLVRSCGPARLSIHIYIASSYAVLAVTLLGQLTPTLEESWYPYPCTLHMTVSAAKSVDCVCNPCTKYRSVLVCIFMCCTRNAYRIYHTCTCIYMCMYPDLGVYVMDSLYAYVHAFIHSKDLDM